MRQMLTLGTLFLSSFFGLLAFSSFALAVLGYLKPTVVPVRITLVVIIILLWLSAGYFALDLLITHRQVNYLRHAMGLRNFLDRFGKSSVAGSRFYEAVHLVMFHVFIHGKRSRSLALYLGVISYLVILLIAITAVATAT